MEFCFGILERKSQNLQLFWIFSLKTNFEFSLWYCSWCCCWSLLNISRVIKIFKWEQKIYFWCCLLSLLKIGKKTGYSKFQCHNKKSTTSCYHWNSISSPISTFTTNTISANTTFFEKKIYLKSRSCEQKCGKPLPIFVFCCMFALWKLFPNPTFCIKKKLSILYIEESTFWKLFSITAIKLKKILLGLRCSKCSMITTVIRTYC